MDTVSADFARAREDIIEIAQTAPSLGPELEEKRRAAIDRADRFCVALPIHAMRSGWSSAETKKRKDDLVAELVSYRKFYTVSTVIINAAIERLNMEIGISDNA
jgi:hypothetical protein